MDVRTVSSFSRNLLNESKFGAYYTPRYLMERMGELLEADDDIVALEPSCGDAEALLGFLSTIRKKEDAITTTYGVDISKEACEKARPKIDHCLHAEFVLGVKASRGINLCFTNPPYGTVNGTSDDRIETQFIIKIAQMMIDRGILCAVLPRQALLLPSFYKALIQRFSVLELLKFPEGEYERFKQYVVIASRKPRQGVSKAEIDEYLEKLNAEDIPVIPSEPYPEDIPKIHIPKAKDKGMEIFTGVDFEPQKAVGGLERSPLYEKMEKMAQLKEYRFCNCGTPVVPLSSGFIGLCAVAGASEGAIGSAKDGTYHFQRGSVKEVRTVENEYDDETGECIGTVETVSHKAALWIIEPNGEIRELT